MKKQAQDYVWHFDFESLLLVEAEVSGWKGQATSQKLELLDSASASFSSRVAAPFVEAGPFPRVGKWWLLVTLAPFTQSFLLPTDPTMIVMFPTRSWEVNDLISGQFLPWISAKISHITSLYTLIPSIGWLSGWKQDWAVVGMVRLHLISFPKLLRGGQEQDIWIP